MKTLQNNNGGADGGRFQQPTYSMKPKQEDEAMGAHLGQIKPKFMSGRFSPNPKGYIIRNLSITRLSELRLRRFKILWKAEKKFYIYYVLRFVRFGT